VILCRILQYPDELGLDSELPLDRASFLFYIINKEEIMEQSSLKRENILEKLKNYKQEFERKYGIKKIGVFGSVARNEANENSDIDIVIEMSEPDMFFAVHIKEILEIDFKRPVDIVRYRSMMNKYLKNRIDREALYV
jgi:predicted nucleotidyltransferase